MQATYQVALTDFRENKTNYSFYFGPNDYKILKKVSPDFEKNVDLGYPIVSWVNKYIIINIFQILRALHWQLWDHHHYHGDLDQTGTLATFIQVIHLYGQDESTQA